MREGGAIRRVRRRKGKARGIAMRRKKKEVRNQNKDEGWRKRRDN